MVGSFAIGTSSVIPKMGLTASVDGTASTDNMAFLRISMWWAGMGDFANFGAYTFAPPIMVTPLGALSVIVTAIFASFLLNERLGHLGCVGCTLCILGSSITHKPSRSFLFYFFTVLIFSLIMAYDVAPRHGRANPLVYISIASLVGGVSVMFVKGLSVRWTFLVGLTYLRVRRVNPIYYVGFCTATIVASLILFQGFNNPSASSTVSLLSGFIVTFLGVHILNLAMLDESEAAAYGGSKTI
ncbi:magnesium transporter NIPA-domain-containing protein [Mycena leptocephala]|nr:magnesium transporter NIPA-domain-containing protein [Mycena leptocephala]